MYEDAVYLAEMLADRGRWADGFPVSSADDYTGFDYLGVLDERRLVLSADDLRRLQRDAQSLLSAKSLDGFKIVGFTAVDASWSPGVDWTKSGFVPDDDFPTFVGSKVPVAPMFRPDEAEAHPHPYVPGGTEYVGDADLVEDVASYEELFTYLSSLRRWVYRPVSLVLDSRVVGSSAEAYYDSYPVVPTQVGDVTYYWSDGATSSETAARNPALQRYMGRSYDSSLDQDVYSLKEYRALAQGGYRVRVHRPFGRSPLDAHVYATSPAVYLYVYCHASGRVSGTSFDEYADCVRKVSVSTIFGADTLVEWPVYYRLDASTVAAVLAEVYGAFAAWVEGRHPGFTAPADGSQDAYESAGNLTVTWRDTFYDTGAIVHDVTV